MKQWNDKKLEKRYNHIKVNAMKTPNIAFMGFNENFFETPTLESWKFNTKSARQWQRIELAYALGQMRAIKDIDDGKDIILPQ
jgi:hypothetical protein